MGADNQQETSRPFYYTGFCVGELSCCLLKLRNRKSKVGGVYYTPDITISNADLSLLKEVNTVIASGVGVITRIKGGFNLSFRGKEKVKKVLTFFDKFPPITGDLSLNKLEIIHQAISILENNRKYRRDLTTQNGLDKCREKLKRIKITASSIRQYSQKIFDPNAIGHFLAGVFDAEGSVGIKSNGSKFQPFVAVAMRDKKIVHLFQSCLKEGYIHLRSQEKIYHWEMGSRKAVSSFLRVFSEKYPVKLVKTRYRMERVRWILNDYTPSPRKAG